MTSFYNDTKLPEVDLDAWGVAHGDMCTDYEHARRGVHMYWKFQFKINASGWSQAEQRVMAYAKECLLNEDLQGSFTETTLGEGLSKDWPDARFTVDLFIVDTDGGCYCDHCIGTAV